MTAHSRFSPSAAHRWMVCPGSLVLAAELPDVQSRYGAEGTVAHTLASLVLSSGPGLDDAKRYIGTEHTQDGFDFVVDDEMAQHVNDYCKLVAEYAEGGTLLVEQRVRISEDPECSGTADVVILHPRRLTVIDLKYGRGVEVDAEDNQQLYLYAVGAVQEYAITDPWTEFETVTVVIHQPRINRVAEHHLRIGELREFALAADIAMGVVAAAAKSVGTKEFSDFLTPGEKQCRWCRAKATCPALAAEVNLAVMRVASAADLAGLDEAPEADLSESMSRVELIEQWCRAVRASVERRLITGKPVRGYKLVEGRKGNRAWLDVAVVEAQLKSWRIKAEQMYEKTLIGPTDAEKLLKKSAPTKWSALQAFIRRSDGKPSVAPAADKRPEWDASKRTEALRDLTAESEMEN
jgi:hypothetical protein